MHSAAILFKEGGPLVVDERATPEPGPTEVLIEVKAVALNPMDHLQRDTNFPPIPAYPAVIGCDAAGIVAKVGSHVSTVVPGTRVLAFISSFYQNGSPDHGAFQKYALAPFETVLPLPDTLSFEEGAVLPIAAVTALTAWTTIGIPIDTKHTPQDNQGVLIWGGASSIGSFSIQSARIMGFTRVYTTASPRHHAYLRGLGADAVFDYRDGDVVAQIVAAAERDGVGLHTAHCAVPDSLQPTLDVLRETKGDSPAMVAHSPVLLPDHPTLDNTEIKFNSPSMEKAARDRHMYQCYHEWLHDNLRAGLVVPSPGIQIEGGGLEGLNAALDKLKAGVSGVKIVVPI